MSQQGQKIRVEIMNCVLMSWQAPGELDRQGRAGAYHCRQVLSWQSARGRSQRRVGGARRKTASDVKHFKQSHGISVLTPACFPPWPTAGPADGEGHVPGEVRRHPEGRSGFRVRWRLQTPPHCHSALTRPVIFPQASFCSASLSLFSPAVHLSSTTSSATVTKYQQHIT